MIFKFFPDQEWIGFNFVRSGLDSGRKISQPAHLWCLYKIKCVSDNVVREFRNPCQNYEILG